MGIDEQQHQPSGGLFLAEGAQVLESRVCWGFRRCFKNELVLSGSPS